MKTAVIIGRFQPVHQEHLNVLFLTALLEYDKVIVLIGSANQARSIKNPFTWHERAWMIQEGCKDILQAGAAGGYFSINEARREFKKYLDKLDSYYTKRQLFKMVKVKQDMRSPSFDTDLEG